MRSAFTGAFAPYICGLIEKKQALGYDYHGSACILRTFDEFCREQFPNETCLTAELAMKWAEQFKTEKNLSRLNRVSVIRELAKYMNSVGEQAYGEMARRACPEVPERVHPHQLRHSRAMHLYRAGMPLVLLSEFLGHADVNTTRIYAWADTEMKRQAIQKVSKVTEGDTIEPIWANDEELIKRLYGLA